MMCLLTFTLAQIYIYIQARKSMPSNVTVSTTQSTPSIPLPSILHLERLPPVVLMVPSLHGMPTIKRNCAVLPNVPHRLHAWHSIMMGRNLPWQVVTHLRRGREIIHGRRYMYEMCWRVRCDQRQRNNIYLYRYA